MDLYVIRDTYNMKFLTAINENGLVTDSVFKKAMILDDKEKAKKLLEFIDDDDYEIQEIILKEMEW